MSDLISRVDTVKALREYADQKGANGEIELANGILKAACYIEEEENIPTAYDVEAVEQELEAFKTTTWSDFMEEEVEIINLERAKKIVRAVGKE